MKKYLLFILTLVYFSYSFAQKSGIVKISGTALSFNNSVDVEDMSEFKDISLPSFERNFISDSNTHFSIQFKLNAPNYFRIGRNILYLSPGDIIKANIDFKDPNKAIFNGSHKIENSFLKTTPYPYQGSFLEAEDGVKPTIDSTIQYIILKSKLRKKQLDSIKIKVTPEFFRLESVRINADLLNSFRYIYTCYSEVHKIPSDSSNFIRNQIASITSPLIRNLSIGMVNVTNLKLAVFRNVLLTILNNQPPNYTIPIEITDWIKASSIKRKAISLDKKLEIIALKIETDSIKTLAYKNALLATIDQLAKLNNGDIAKDVVFKGVTKNSVFLSSFKGKVIYVEFWATWCIPCLEDKPKMEALKAAYNGNDSIVFISVSIDDDQPKWNNYLTKHHTAGNEFIVDRNMLTDYNLLSVPRMILINKDFTIEQLYASGPGDKRLIKTLDMMIKK